MQTMHRSSHLRKMAQTKKPVCTSLVIFGAGGHATSMANVAISAGYVPKNFVEAGGKARKLHGTDVIGDLSEIDNISSHHFAIAIGDNAKRQEKYEELSDKHPDLIFPALIHVSATISLDVVIGPGSVVMPNAVVGPNTKIGRFCILNTQCSIDHDSEMLDFSSLAPGAITGGTVAIGIRSAISIGAIVKHDINIGDDCVLGANSYLNNDLPSNALAYGTPAKIVKQRKTGEPYLK